MSKSALDLVKEPFEYIALDLDEDLKSKVKADNGSETIPVIMKDGLYFGGYSELEEWITDKYL
tara:strand:- start:22010 stop:22198 length:189 start_codon:yes stop_codon:yes gene_type:complete